MADYMDSFDDKTVPVYVSPVYE